MRVRLGSLRASGEGRVRPLGGRRCGAALVEFALVIPVLVTLILGAMEFSRAIMVKEVLQDAVRKACRLSIQPGKANAAITTEVNNILSDNKIASGNATLTIMVNGVVADASTAVRGDQVSVKVSVPVAQVSWTPPLFLTGTTLESETLVMIRQG